MNKKRKKSGSTLDREEEENCSASCLCSSAECKIPKERKIRRVNWKLAGRVDRGRRPFVEGRISQFKAIATLVCLSCCTWLTGFSIRVFIRGSGKDGI
ncbi:hypothetical protein Nepgr_029363 [Nepenthes gracilis]|uniref:Transmembrane protein n=1 Tax=Nepenthes gracilis TaxID=150966 RepID=A0AAD3TDF7_NEPGR|nr:hypothetical protein Nepgr_029363 [Nepenthes gracilis]